MPSDVLTRVMLSLTCILLLVGQSPGTRAYGQETAQDEEQPGVQASLFDTGRASSAPLKPDDFLSKSGWTKLPEDETDHKFTGSAVLANDRLAAIFRPGGPGAEVYSLRAAGPVLRAVLAPVAEAADLKLARVAVVENTPGLVAVDAAFKAPGGKSAVLRYELELGQAFVRTEARAGATGLQVEAPCRFAVLPDFFADDIVVDAAEIPVDEAELPSENFLLHMLGEGDAIVMSVADTREQDFAIALAGEHSGRVIRHSRIQYGKEGKIWVAVIEGRGVWHRREITEDDAGKVLRLDWRAPYPAQWRVDWRQEDKLIDSWEMLSQRPDGQYVKHGWFGQPESYGTPDWMRADRKRWTTVLGWFQYPCWADKDGQGYLEPLERKAPFRGPAILYPINRLQATPVTALTVVDVVRATLGVGPCQYILDVEGQEKESRGIATCAARDKLVGIYERKQQKQQRAAVEEALVDVLAFVHHIRKRIDDYVAFGHETLAYLAEQKKAHPELAGPITEMETLARKVDGYAKERWAAIEGPVPADKLVEDFRAALLDYEGDDALEKCRKFGKAITRIGGNQDELVGECRMAVKLIRQRSGLMMAVDPRTAEIAGEIRRRTQQMLRNPTSYEAPRH